MFTFLGLALKAKLFEWNRRRWLSFLCNGFHGLVGFWEHQLLLIIYFWTQCSSTTILARYMLLYVPSNRFYNFTSIEYKMGGSYVHHVVEKQKLPSFFIDGFDKFEQKKRWKRYGGRNKIPLLQLQLSLKKHAYCFLLNGGEYLIRWF